MKTERVETTNFHGDWNAPCPYCGAPQLSHKQVFEHENCVNVHRQPCRQEQDEISRGWVRRARSIKIVVLIWWVLIPLAIAILGFASVIVGILLFAISLVKIVWTAVKLFGKPERWISGYRDDREKRQLMEHYYYHCERNPEGFKRIREENFAEEDPL